MVLTLLISTLQFTKGDKVRRSKTNVVNSLNTCFGKVTEGDLAQHVYKFKNTGKAPLVITNASGSCGCTVPSWPKEPIAPGAGGEIKVSYNSTGKSGREEKEITVLANTIPNKTTLRISALVIDKP